MSFFDQSKGWLKISPCREPLFILFLDIYLFAKCKNYTSMKNKKNLQN